MFFVAIRAAVIGYAARVIYRHRHQYRLHRQHQYHQGEYGTNELHKANIGDIIHLSIHDMAFLLINLSDGSELRTTLIFK
jgi:hypothetical protein